MDPSRGMASEAIVARFFAVVNDHDAGAVPALFHPSAELVMGPHVAGGHEEIRGIVLQEPPDLDIRSEPIGVEPRGDVVVIPFRRTQVWRKSGETAVEEDLWAVMTIADDGRIARVELLREPPGA
jgi:ketosteroid isomerase-like protein